MSSIAVQPEAVLRDLSDLWASLASAQSEDGGVLRACAMTLVVAAAGEQDADRSREAVGLLMRDHPSRAVVIRPGNGGDGGQLQAHVFAECWKPFGKTQQICAEGIEVLPGAAGWSDVARFLVPLRAPDLPTVLWCRELGPLFDGRYRPLFNLANKIIFDTQPAPEAQAALDRLRELSRQGYRVADLHWTRLTRWREALANLFDAGTLREGGIESVRITYAGAEPATCALYGVAWMRSSLPGVPVSMSPAELDVGGSGSARTGLHSFLIATPQGVLTVERDGESCLRVSGCGHDDRSPFGQPPEAALMREELGILGPDPVYERALAV